ncbi:MAG TPA: hypothetical protein VIL74_13030 [Pyrinomonadaceae bacterium]|jgi:hypothetical protein
MKKKAFCVRFFIFWVLLCFCAAVPAAAQTQQNSPNLYEQFKVAELRPCGQRAEAVRLGKLILEQYRLAENFEKSFKVRLSALDQEEARCSGKSIEKSIEILFEEFKQARKQPCGQRQDAVRMGREIIDLSKNVAINIDFVDYIQKETAKIEAADKNCQEANSLEKLLGNYRIARYQPCGNRSKAIQLGKQIIELHGDDLSDESPVKYVKKDVAKVETDDRICQRNNRYNQAYKTKNWREFFAVSKEIIAEEGDKPLALDVMLTFAAVGHRLTAYERGDAYNTETVSYAKKALELIGSGVRTQSRWGVFEPFGKMDKAQAWLNYIVGYISYFRLKENKKAIPYFYQSTKYASEFKYDAFVYQAVAIHYFERESVMASTLSINDFITRANNPAAFDEANASPEETGKNNEIVVLYKQLVNLYNLRYNLAPEENVTGLTDYIQKIISRPLVDTGATKVKTSTPAGY